MFNCKPNCALCCKNVGWNRLLPSTNGVCDYLIDDLCSIYENRPEFCRVDESYVHWKDTMTLQQYYDANEAICNGLKEKAC